MHILHTRKLKPIPLDTQLSRYLGFRVKMPWGNLSCTERAPSLCDTEMVIDLPQKIETGGQSDRERVMVAMR